MPWQLLHFYPCSSLVPYLSAAFAGNDLNRCSMPSAKLVTHLLLAFASLNAVAHRPSPARHHTPAGKHQLATSHQAKAKSKRTTKTNGAKKASQHATATSGRHSRKQRAAKHLVASQPRHTKLAQQRATKASHVARTTRHSEKPRAEHQPGGYTYKVTATVYQAVPGQTDRSPFITADNSRIRPRYGSHTRWLALSPDLLRQNGGKFNYGDKVQVSQVSPQLDGVYTVHDTMNRRHRRRIDILTHRREKLSICAPGARLRLADAPPAARKSRARATVVAHARPGRGSKVRAVSLHSRARSKRNASALAT